MFAKLMLYGKYQRNQSLTLFEQWTVYKDNLYTRCMIQVEEAAVCLYLLVIHSDTHTQ